MTIEQKAKAYDEAIKKAESLYKAAEPMSGCNVIIETLFPELKENEDERIMKEIAEFIYNAAFKPKDIKKKEKWLTWLEKQGEQKPADKVEPKFKVGNWYQCTKDFFGKGVTFDKNTAYYCAKEGCLQDEYGCHIAIVKDLYDNFKLWTIQDAKDGDVLVLNDEVFIYAHRKQLYSIAVAHCFVDGAGGFYFDGEFGYTEKGNSIHPATKEQRDQLEKAMTNAGWEFDFDKKELKKIEQKSAWSEEDEHRINDTIYFLETSKKHYASTVELDACIDWLKSIKERFVG